MLIIGPCAGVVGMAEYTFMCCYPSCSVEAKSPKISHLPWLQASMPEAPQGWSILNGQLFCPRHRVRVDRGEPGDVVDISEAGKR